MDIIYTCCAGLDVHKATVVACVRRVDAGGKVQREVRTFTTMTRGLLELGDWLRAENVTHAAMESTGVYWKPVFNILGDQVQLILVNAQHIKQVPGRKTDVKDCEWIAQLLQMGLLRASFVPPAPIRDLRELTRQRVQLLAERTAAANRIQKVLEDANIKLASVATDVLGVSGRAILEALIAGETNPAELARLAVGKLRRKVAELQLALEGKVSDNHRFLLRMLLDHVRHQEELVERMTVRIEEVMAPFASASQNLQTIPGVGKRVAEVILAEIGPDMSMFATADHLASWAGMSPGNNESAGKRRSGHTTSGSHWLRAMLVQAAWSASHTRGTYLAEQFRRLAARRGKKRALIAVGHSILVIAYHLLKKGTTYNELGADYFSRLDPERITRNLVKRLQKMGHKVTLEPLETAA